MSETLGEVLTAADVVICCGSGGVGKTTTAAAVGLQAAQLGRRAVVVTIDPAKRLADALGVPGGLTNDPIRLPVADGPGELWALMLDTASTFDGLVQSNAASPEQAERILGNRFYRNIAGSLSGTQEYMAGERLHDLHGDPRFDLIVVDTPPTRNALDFLDAPNTLTRFIDHPLFKLMMLPTRRGLRMLSVATQPMIRMISKVVGGETVADAMAFFQAFSGMETGFRQRADEVLTLLRSEATRFMLVASPRSDTVEEARFFAARLADSGLGVAALVVNRSTPVFGEPPDERPTDGSGVLYDNLVELSRMAAAERIHLGALEEQTGVTAVWVPMLPSDVHDTDGLETIRALLFPLGLDSGGTHEGRAS
jgi:anion-transporting  ArsA/GET3 family ATPase